MKKTSFYIVFLGSFFFSTYASAQCDKKLTNESLNYIATNIFKNEKEFYSDKFRLGLKKRLVQKISSYVQTSTSMKSSFSLKGLKSKKSNTSKTRINAIALVVNAHYTKCGNIAIISVNKKTYNQSQYNNFIRQLTFHSRNLNNLLKGMDESVSRRFVRKKVKFYTNILQDLSSLLPLVKLPNEDKLLMNQFSIDVSNLENKSDQLKQKRNAKLKKMATDFKNGFKNLIDNF